MDVIAVDWSGAKSGASTRLWLAHVRGGALVALGNGRNRRQVIDDLIGLRSQCADGLVVGLDFAFSFPAWFLQEKGYRDVGELWRAAAAEGERWLADCAPPFWGQPGRRRPALAQHLRRAEQFTTAGGIGPKSVFQVGGAGSVGTGSVRGMPYLPALRAAGFSIWPFDPRSEAMVLEIYPRLLTGPVHKRNPDDRRRYMHDAPWPVDPAFAALIADSEDAFDAAFSALVMAEHQAELAILEQATDPTTQLEGDIWPPPNITL